MGLIGALAFSGIGEAEVLARVREMAFGFLREIRDRSGKCVTKPAGSECNVN